MQYVAILRATRMLKWYAVALLASITVDLVTLWQHGGEIAAQMSHDKNPMIPFSALLAGAFIAPIILAAFFATGLDAEYKTAAIAWTRPVSRTTIAAWYVAVDLVAMLLVVGLTLVTILACVELLGIGKYISLGDGSWARVPLLFGISVMWYGLVVLLAALLPGRGKAIAGASWAYALVVPSLASAPFPGLVHAILVGLSYVSPLTYGASSNGRGAVMFSGGPGHILTAWAIGVAAIAVGTQLWARREVPA